MNWVILCPGPSLVKTFAPPAASDHIIAVNGAILFHPHADIWAMLDLEVFSYCSPRFPAGMIKPTLWIPPRWEADIHPSFNLYPAYTEHHKEFIPGATNAEFAAAVSFGTDIKWRTCTMFVAIGMAIMRGARDITIYGADMAGSGYFAQGLENCRTRHTDKRWDEERHLFQDIVTECAARNITITRITAEGK